VARSVFFFPLLPIKMESEEKCKSGSESTKSAAFFSSLFHCARERLPSPSFLCFLCSPLSVCVCVCVCLSLSLCGFFCCNAGDEVGGAGKWVEPPEEDFYEFLSHRWCLPSIIVLECWFHYCFEVLRSIVLKI